MISRVLLAAGASILLAGPVFAQNKAPSLISVSQGWSRPAPAIAPVLGGFLIIRNDGTETDRLIEITSPISADIQIHLTQVEHDKAAMRKVTGGLEIPAGSEVKFKPGGYHIMFMKPNDHPVSGSAIPLTLRFEKAGLINAELLVSGAQPATITHGADHKQ